MFTWDDIEKDDKLPHKIMEHKFNVIYNRNWKEYLNSIEWDGLWLKHDTEEERIERTTTILYNSHPFKKWIDKNSIILKK